MLALAVSSVMSFFNAKGGMEYLLWSFWNWKHLEKAAFRFNKQDLPR